MAGALFQMMAELNLVHVPYRGEALAITDLLAGQVQVVFGSLAPSTPYVKGGQLRALAVTSTSRAEALPDIPAMADFLAGYEMTTWYGIGAPKKHFRRNHRQAQRGGQRGPWSIRNSRPGCRILAPP